MRSNAYAREGDAKMDDLTERALKLLRECPDLIEEAEDGAPIWNSIAGNLLAMETGCSRWATEKAVREALRLMKKPRARRPRWRDFETTALNFAQDAGGARNDLLAGIGGTSERATLALEQIRIGRRALQDRATRG